ncbi:hypothetical protein QJS10_CPB12g00198 [Acorus calamus]|uniref:Conserved oligomeric Golgi complex subunit 1 n=1 Tax=Acorus calamus TaxID=4465 RepID=A0AAV9DMI9_ACOCL|nr:hypothetical protein QJS10_CPB12g00198 [Acorus calamus]
MRLPSPRHPPPSPSSAATDSGHGTRDAESIFRTKPISEIRAVESSTRLEIESKKEELRQLVGRSYRDLIDSADTIVLMRSSCDAISANLSRIDSAMDSLSSSAQSESEGPSAPKNPPGPPCTGSRAGSSLREWQIVESFKAQISQKSRERLSDPSGGFGVSAYADALAAIATVDDLNPEQALSLFLDSRRSWVLQRLNGSFADTEEGLSLAVASVLCDVARIIRDTLGQVGELFLHVLNDLPLFYKSVLGVPPGTQLFGGIPNPEEEAKLWKEHRERLESVMAVLEAGHVARACTAWLESCVAEMFGDRGRLIDVVHSGEGLASIEQAFREVLDGPEGLEGSSLEQWLRGVFGSEIVESPWKQIRGLVLKDGKDVLEAAFEGALVERMKEIVKLGFDDLPEAVDVKGSVRAVVAGPGNKKASLGGGGVWFLDPHRKKTGFGHGIKAMAVEANDFKDCWNLYFGDKVSLIRDTVDSKCRDILNDLLCFVESQNSTVRLKELAPYLQEKCYQTLSSIVKGYEEELGLLSAGLGGKSRGEEEDPSVIVERSLFIGRIFFALRNHSSSIPLILGSPKQWGKETSATFSGSSASELRHSFDSHPAMPYSPRSPRRLMFESPRSPRRQTLSTAAALFAADENTNPKLDDLNKMLRNLCIKAHSMWILWVSNELSALLTKDLEKDDALSATTPLRDIQNSRFGTIVVQYAEDANTYKVGAVQGWEVTMIKQDESNEGPLEMKIALPSMPSLYIISFLFQACQEIHRVGGHVLDKIILENFAWRLLEKVVGVYENFHSTIEGRTPQVSEKGILQILLDLRFTMDILSGGRDSSLSSPDLNSKEDLSRVPILKPPYRRKQPQNQADSVIRERVMGLIHGLSQRLDPIDWATYEPYLWENEKQSYKRYAVLFGFFVQLNRMYTDAVQKLPTKTNSESNILRCSTVPRFKYLPISAPVLSARGARKPTISLSDDASSGISWRGYSNGEHSPKSEFDDTSGFGVTAPLIKSIMTQVGSKLGESTSRLGFMHRSAAAMSNFGDILPVQAAGLLSSFTAGAGRSES